jgi:hypothetical protein
LSALQQLVFGVYLLDRSSGVITDEILSHHHITRLCGRKVRLRSDDRAEALQIGGGEQIGMVALQHDLARFVASFRVMAHNTYVIYSGPNWLAGVM